MKYQVLYTLMNQLSPIPVQEWEHLENISILKTATKNTIILNNGEQALELFLIISGCVRMYYINEDGKEFNHAFLFESSIVAGYPSLVSQQPSKFVIETVEDTTYLSINYKKFLPFYDQHPCWNQIARIALEQNYIDKLEREAILLTKDLQAKYKSAIELYPQLKTRIPQYHIASFLGATPSALNRILKKELK